VNGDLATANGHATTVQHCRYHSYGHYRLGGYRGRDALAQDLIGAKSALRAASPVR
jgi:hypothetical protein